MDDAGLQDLGYDVEARLKLPKVWWELSYSALEASDWLQRHSIVNVQTIL